MAHQPIVRRAAGSVFSAPKLRDVDHTGPRTAGRRFYSFEQRCFRASGVSVIRTTHPITLGSAPSAWRRPRLGRREGSDARKRDAHGDGEENGGDGENHDRDCIALDLLAAVVLRWARRLRSVEKLPVDGKTSVDDSRTSRHPHTHPTTTWRVERPTPRTSGLRCPTLLTSKRNVDPRLEVLAAQLPEGQAPRRCKPPP